MRADQTIHPTTSSRMPASGVALLGGCLELWREQDIQLTCTHIDIELEALLCGRHRDETMYKKTAHVFQLRAGRRPRTKPTCIKFVRCEHRDLKRGAAR